MDRLMLKLSGAKIFCNSFCNSNFVTLRHSLMTFGNKFSASEVDDAFAEFKIDGGMIDGAHLKGLMVSK